MKRKFTAMTLIFAFSGCGISQNDDLSGFNDSQIYTLSGSIFQASFNISSQDQNLLVIKTAQSSEFLPISLATQAVYIIKEAYSVGTFMNHKGKCENGEMEINIDHNKGTFGINMEGCRMMSGDYEINCYISGGFETGEDGSLKKVNMKLHKGCSTGNNKLIGDMFFDFKIKKIGSKCIHDREGGISTSFLVTGGPFRIGDEFGNFISLEFIEINVYKDVMCMHGANVMEMEGYLKYKDNFCVNRSVNINVSTETELNLSWSNCSGKLKINDIVFIELNNDCSVNITRNGNLISHIGHYMNFHPSMNQCN